MLAYRAREHNKTSQTLTKREKENEKEEKTASVLKNVMQEDRKGKERVQEEHHTSSTC